MRLARRTDMTSPAAASAMLAAPPALRAQPARMRLSHQYPPDHHIARMLAAFAEDATARRAGIEVEVFPAERLARVAENVPGVARGAIEAAVATNFTWGNTIPKTRAPTIPFLFTELGRIEEFPGSEAARFLDAARRGAACARSLGSSPRGCRSLPRAAARSSPSPISRGSGSGASTR